MTSTCNVQEGCVAMVQGMPPWAFAWQVPVVMPPMSQAWRGDVGAAPAQLDQEEPVVAKVERAARRRMRQRMNKKEGKALAKMEAAALHATELVMETKLQPLPLPLSAMRRIDSDVSTHATEMCPHSPVGALPSSWSWSDMSEEIIIEEDCWVDLPLRVSASMDAESPKDDVNAVPTPPIMEHVSESVPKVPLQKKIANTKIVPVCAVPYIQRLLENPLVRQADVPAKKRELAIDDHDDKVPSSFEMDGYQVVNTFVHFRNEEAVRERLFCRRSSV